jgi:Ammonia permease
MDHNAGLFYDNAKLLVTELFGVLFILTWTMGVMTPFFYILNILGMFRVDPLEEHVGLDISHHRGSAYNLELPDPRKVEELAEKRAIAHGKNASSSSAVMNTAAA